MIPAALLGLIATAGAVDVVLEDELATAPVEPVIFVPFEVPAGVAELRFERDDRSDANILDWGLMGPDGFRGWSGGNSGTVLVNADAATPGYLPGPMPGTWELMIGFAKVVETPVRWRVELTFADTPTLPADTDRGAWVAPDPLRTGRAWYAGDFHVHSEHSGDARPTLDAVADEAVRRGLDFVEISEHNTTSHLGLLPAVQRRHPSLLLLPGVEWTTYRGHANAIGATSFVPFWVGSRGLTADAAAEAAIAQGALFAPNHPTLELGNLCIGCAWKQDVDVVRLSGLEIQGGSVDVVGLVMLEGALALWDALCDQGVHVAAIGGSDDHEGGQGSGPLYSPIGAPRTYVQADGLWVEAILQGIRDNRTVVKLGGPDDPWAELDADAEGGPTRDVRVRVQGAAGGQLQLVQDGEVVQVVPLDADEVEHVFRADVPEQGETRVRAHVLVDGAPRTITSHVWLRREALDTGVPRSHDDGYCTCASTSPAAWSAWLLALGALAALRRRR